MRSDDILYSKLFTDMMAEGFIAIDEEGIIQIYNDSAKEIFGIKNKSNISHPSGVLKKGDLVIIANNSFSGDDGDMNKDSLKKLGLKGDELELEDAFILISKFEEENLDINISLDKMEKLELSKEYDELDIYSFINFKEQKINISIDGHDFKLDYIDEIGHMVILDGKNYDLKFYQTNGYTARKESINDILKGRKYKAKGSNSDLLKVIGENIFDIHSSESIVEDFYNLAKGKDIECIDKYEKINGYPTLCTLKAIEIEDDRKGAALIVEDISKMEEVIRERDKIIKKLEKTSKYMKEERQIQRAFPNFIGNNKEILNVKRMALAAAKTMSPVLLIGKKGVGKSLLAKNIHNASEKRNERFLHLDGKTIKDFNDIENIGTLYIENIDELSLGLQEELLDILEDESEYADLRFITSTSKDLDEMMIEEEFRDDLYFRINILPILIPELKDRKDDITLLVDYLLPKICKKAGIEEKRISMEAMDMIKSYHWPDNIRELENVLERAVNYALGNNILTKHIVLLEDMKNINNEKMTLKESLEEREKTIIKNTLSLNKGDRKKTIDELGISQSTFYEKLNKYNIK